MRGKSERRISFEVLDRRELLTDSTFSYPLPYPVEITAVNNFATLAANPDGGNAAIQSNQDSRFGISGVSPDGRKNGDIGGKTGT